MSSSGLLQSGGTSGGEDSTTDDTDGAGSNVTDGGGDGGGSSDGGLSVFDVRRIVNSMLPGWVKNPPRVLKAFLENPVATVATLVVGWLWADILRPVLEAVWEVGISFVAAVAFLANSIAIVTLSTIDLVVGGFTPVGAQVLTTLGDFNGAIAQVASDAGLGAPAVVTGLYAVEFGIVVYGSWALVNTIDIPGVDLGGLMRVVLAPIRFIGGILR